MAKDKKPSSHETHDSSLDERDTSLFSIDKIRSGTSGSLITKIFMGILVVIFAVGFLFMGQGFSGPGGGGGGGGGQGAAVDLTSVVASLGDQTVTRGEFLQAEQSQERMMAQYGMTIGPNELLAMEYRTLQSLAGNMAMIQAAQNAGIQVTDKEIDAKIKSFIDQQIEQQSAQNPAGFRRQVEARFGSEEGYRKELNTQMQQNRESVRSSLLIEKLQQKIEAGTKTTEETYKRSHTKLKVRQLVIDPPAISPTTKDPETAQKRTIATAKNLADKLAKQAKAKPTVENFVALVKKYTDDENTKKTGGDLGWKIPQEFPIDYPMRDALMKSEDKIVGPLQDGTTKAFFIFYIEGRKLDLPKDYEKKKDEYLKTEQTARAAQAWSSYQQKVSAQAQEQLQIQSPTLQAFALQSEKIPAASGAQADALRKQAVELYLQGLNSAIATEAAAIRLQLASLYTSLKQPQKAVDVLALAAKNSPQEPQILISYAVSLREAKKEKEALQQLKAASELLDSRPSTPSMFGGNPNDALRFQIASEFDALGKKELADKERKKIQPRKPMTPPAAPAAPTPAE